MNGSESAAAQADVLEPSGRLRSDLWVDRDDAGQEIERRRQTGILSQAEAGQLETLRQHGYCVLRPDFPGDLFSSLQDDVDRVWREQPPEVAFAYQGLLTRFTGANGAARQPSCRLADLHGWSEAARSLYLDAAIFRFVELAFGEPAVATQSLYFEWGSQQALHRDPMHVRMQHPAHLFAAWVALEDISADCGPLVYVPGSHRLPYYQFAPGQIVHDDRRDGIEGIRRAEAWDQEYCNAAGLGPEPFLARRGDVLIWHHSLLHGGSVPADKGLTRKSFVIHYSTRRAMSQVSNTYLDPYAAAPGEPPVRRVYTTRRLLRAPGAVGFDSPLRDEFVRTARAMVANGGQRLAERVAAMEASRFWQARNAWFAVKRRLGLTSEA